MCLNVTENIFKTMFSIISKGPEDRIPFELDLVLRKDEDRY